MILKKEIEKIAEEKGVAKSTIDKDWVLSHFLAAIYSEPKLREILIFKGGTCLKKCYFSDYRFSEDLDFTSKISDFELKRSHLDFICWHVKENAEIMTQIDSLTPLHFENKLTGYEGVIKFWGADHPRNEAPAPPERWHTKIKLEIILYEKVLFDQANKKIIHLYSDKPAIHPNAIPCYSIEEMLSEKLRSLIQRSYSAPRDFYDIWYLSKYVAGLDWNKIAEAFYEKVSFKGLSFSGIDQMINDENSAILRKSWENSLRHQITGNSFPNFEVVKKNITELLIKVLKVN